MYEWVNNAVDCLVGWYKTWQSANKASDSVSILHYSMMAGVQADRDGRPWWHAGRQAGRSDKKIKHNSCINASRRPLATDWQQEVDDQILIPFH